MLLEPLLPQHLPRPHHHLPVAQLLPLALPQDGLHRVAERPERLPSLRRRRAHVRGGLVGLAPAQQDPLVGLQRVERRRLQGREAEPEARLGAERLEQVGPDIRGDYVS